MYFYGAIADEFRSLSFRSSSPRAKRYRYVDALANYLGLHDDSEFETVGECWEMANTLVRRYIGSAVVPVEVLDRVILEVGASLYRRQSAPGGATQFTTFDSGDVVRISGDPLAGFTPSFAPTSGRWSHDL